MKLSLKDTRSTYIGGIYRPPDGSLQNALDFCENKLIDIQMEGIPDIVIKGDWNVDLLKASPNKRRYLDFIKMSRRDEIISTAT